MRLRGRELFALVAVAVLGAGALFAFQAPALAAARLPGAPSKVTATAQNAGAVVKWQAPAADGGSPVTGYVITASPGGKRVHVSAITSYAAGGLTNGRAYTFRVAAVTKAGTGPASKPSAPVTPHAPAAPGPPRSVSATAGFEQIVVNWTAPASNGGAPVSGYRVTAEPGGVTVTVAGDASSATVAGLRDGTRYKVSVAAENSAGAGRAAVAAGSQTPHMTAPGAPASVTAAPASSGVSVAWQPPAADGGAAVSGYVIAVSGSSKKLTAKPAARSVAVTGLIKGHSYTFTVAARNAKGTGPAAPSPPAAAGGTVGAKTVVLSAASLSGLGTVGTNGSLRFTSATAQVKGLKAGAILVAGVSKATPAGLLAQVTKVTKSGSVVTVATVPAALNQALSAAGFGISSALSREQVASFVPARAGVGMVPAAARGASAGSGIGFTLNVVLYKASNGAKVTASGTLSVTPDVSFSASITSGGVKSSFKGTVTAAATVKLSAQVTQQLSAGGYPLGTLNFTPVSFTVLGVPIVITPALSLKLTDKGTVSAGLVATAGDSYTAGVKVTTDNASVSAAPISSHQTTFSPPTVSGTMSAAAGVEGDLTANVNGIAGITLSDSLWLAELTVNTASNPWWMLNAENILALKFNVTVLGHTFTAYSKTLSDKTIPLARAPGPFPGVAVSPNPAKVAPGGHVQLSGQANGDTGSTFTWTIPSGDGSVSSSGLYTAPPTPGIYTVTAALTASGLQPASSGQASIQVGSQPPGPPSGVTAASASDGDATITWTPPADNGGSAVTAYTIKASPGGATYLASGSATNETISGLTPGDTYTFTMTAKNAGGTSVPSAPSEPVEIDNVTVGAGWTAAEAPLPAGLKEGVNPVGPDLSLTSVDCSSVVACVAVGSFTDSSGAEDGLILAEVAGSWTALKAPLPAGMSAPQYLGLAQVSCATAGPCVAVGRVASTGAFEGLLVSDVSGTWTAVTVPLPPDADSTNNVELTAVNCPSALSCVAVGTYYDTSGNQWPLMLTESGGAWTAAQGSLPSDLSDSGGFLTFDSVACLSDTSCVTAGTADLTGDTHGVIIAGYGSSWTPTEAPVDSSSGTSTTSLTSVACTSSECVAAGDYNSGNGVDGDEALMMTGGGALWTPAEVPLPDSSPVSSAEFSVTCPSDSSCVASGDYVDSSNVTQAVSLTGLAALWTLGQAQLPGNAIAGAADLNSVACPDDTSCVAVGRYDFGEGNGEFDGLIETGLGESWTSAEAPVPANVLSGDGEVSLNSVACPVVSDCVAVGSYLDTDGFNVGVLVTQSP